MKQLIFGSDETVEFPEFSGISTLAKVDTGAWSCALHCEDVRVENDELIFRPLAKDHVEVRTSNFDSRTVVSSNGTSEERYVTTMKIRIKGVDYQTEVTLADRKPMSRDMLIGKLFLLEQQILVDVTLNQPEDE